MRKISNKSKVFFLLVGSTAVLLAAVLSIFYGSTEISPSEIIRALKTPDLFLHQHLVILELRIPRTLGCFFVGAAFATAGAIMQGITGNPLADSGLLGINSGAVFALALCMAFLPTIGFSKVVLFSFLGASGAMLLVYGMMTLKKKKLDSVRLILAGTAVSIFLSSLSQGIALFFRIGKDLTFWTAGGMAGIRNEQLIFAVPVISAGLLMAMFLSKKISLLSLGEDAAKGLGLHIERTRILCLFCVLLLAGGAVALAGPIAFVGLLVPHIVRFFVGADYRWTLPCSLIYGAFFMIAADIISRTVNAPSETPIGLVFSIMGVPFFLWTVRKEAKGFE